MLRLLAVAVVVTGCSNLIVVRGSSNDFLKRKATKVTLNAPQNVVQQRMDELMDRRGFRPISTQAAGDGTSIVIYKGSRHVPREVQNYGITLGSWFAARLGPSDGNATSTDVTLMGKPMIGNLELCSDHDNLLEDIKYMCTDTKVAPDWAGKNLVSGRDETEVVSGVLADLYERLKH
jgi:hypothetical protein